MTDKLNSVHYINLSFTDLVTYEDNEEDAGSEKVNGWAYNCKDDQCF